MYGRHFESMYEGSMYGAGVSVFAVWGYVIAKARGGVVELNPMKLADTLGGSLEEIQAAIAFLTAPDPQSRFKENEGRRLVKEGEFQYRIPSWETYRRIKSSEDLREYNRVKKAESRARMKVKGQPLVGEREYVRAVEGGDVVAVRRIEERQGVGMPAASAAVPLAGGGLGWKKE